MTSDRELNKEIEETAKALAEKKWVINQRAVYKDGFKDGASWMFKIMDPEEIEKLLNKARSKLGW